MRGKSTRELVSSTMSTSGSVPVFPDSPEEVKQLDGQAGTKAVADWSSGS